jgi:Zn-finger nucleic acid-binding protein
MNCISGTIEHEIQLDLKYCERCGGLWLRRKGDNGVYCAGCCAHFAALPNPGKTPPRKPRRRKSRGASTKTQVDMPEHSAPIEQIEGAGSMGVWA